MQHKHHRFLWFSLFSCPMVAACGDEACTDTEEVCNGVDDDCDGIIDEDASNAVDLYPDVDGDGFGSATAQAMHMCPRDGFVTDATDCDDATAAVNPDATEVCGNRIDDNCDGGAGECDWTPGGDSSSPEPDANWSLGSISVVRATGDLTGDGFDDLALIEEDGADIIILTGGFPLEGDDADLEPYTTVLVGAGVDLYTVDGIGDFNGDDFQDLLVGIPSWGDHGAAVLAYGEDLLGSDLLDQGVLFEGEERYEYYDESGWWVGGAGDLDADGLDDAVVGTRTVGSIALYLLRGEPDRLTGTMSLADADTRVLNPRIDYAYGMMKAWAAGDLNGDGYPDMAVSATSDETYVICGPVESGTHDLEIESVASLRNAHSLDAVGDWDDDGFADILLGTGSAAYLVFGPVTGTTDIDETELTFGFAEDLGECVANVGDTNHDGFTDLALANGAGDVRLLPGTGSRPGETASLADMAAGFDAYHVAGQADVDGDGAYDLVLAGRSDVFFYLARPGL